MAKVNNSEVIQKLIDELELYPGQDVIPTEVADKILPTFQINSQEVIVQNPTANVVRYATQGTAGSSTIYAVPATGKFYLTNVTLEVRGTPAAGGSGEAYVSIDIDGSTQNIARLRKGAKDANDYGEIVTTINLQNPILVDAGSNITLTTEDNAFDGYAVIVGYTQAD